MSDYSSEEEVSSSEEEVSSKRREEPFDEIISSNYEVPNKFRIVTSFQRRVLMLQTCSRFDSYDVEKDMRGRVFIKALRNMVKNSQEEYRRTELAEEFEMIGVTVKRISDMGYHMGVVVDYDKQTRLYKIEYEDENVEKVNINELRKIVTPVKMVSKCTSCIEARKHKKKKKKSIATTSSSSYSSN